MKHLGSLHGQHKYGINGFIGFSVLVHKRLV